MDSLTHTLVGTALAKTRLGAASPLAPLALVVGANLPDAENFVLAFFDGPTNMIHHRSVTHSVLGVLLLIPLFTLLIRGLERLRRRGRPRGSFPGLLAGVALVVGTHPVLDWLNTYGVRPWLPFDGTWYHGDLVFIVDPYIWLALLAATALAGRRTLTGSLALTAIGGAMVAAALLAGGLAPPWIPYGMTAGVGLILVYRWRIPRTIARIAQRRTHSDPSADRQQRATALEPGATALEQCARGEDSNPSVSSLSPARRRPGRFGFGARHPDAIVAGLLLLCVAYVGFLGWSGRTAWRMSRAVLDDALPPNEPVIRRTISPQPADPLGWQIVAETPVAVYRHEFSILQQPGGLVRMENGRDDPIVRNVADSRPGEAWRTFSRHPVAAVAVHGDGRRVYLLDARYPMFPPRDFASQVIELPARPRPHASAARDG